MAPRQAKRNIQKVGRQCSVPKGEQARPQGIKKERPQLSPRRSPRLRRQDRTISKDSEPKYPLPSPTSKTPSKEPKEYFKSESNINHLLARKKSSLSLRGKQLETSSAAPSSTTPSDQKPREAKSAPILLETKGSFMRKSDLGIADTSKTVYRTLLEDRNEAKVIQDIARLIIPSAQSLAIHGAKHLKTLIESDNSIALTKPRPQPDYAVRFKRTAFTEDQLKKIQPFISSFSEMSLFMSTYYIYFPFLTCEVKCGAAALDIADR
ncbi:hypothetical protein LSUB1_G008301 [Lachnellula subtilissima]|uniref:DUF7924 domain-containing protein n=1 Tax=Lachnellula subtilissima TaxID=602034 RepID=A0A8H8U2I5_9HELO|nr:hypothetical protein LSUB1_G008301 [Lachnellula subtilissima]